MMQRIGALETFLVPRLGPSSIRFPRRRPVCRIPSWQESVSGLKNRFCTVADCHGLFVFGMGQNGDVCAPSALPARRREGDPRPRMNRRKCTLCEFFRSEANRGMAPSGILPPQNIAKLNSSAALRRVATPTTAGLQAEGAAERGRRRSERYLVIAQWCRGRSS